MATVSSPYKFSVVVSTGTSAPALRRCISSILGQTFRSYEVIIVDDGSISEAGGIGREFVDSHPNVKYVYQGARGTAAARNLGASMAQGRFVAFLNHDDEVLPSWLESFDQALTRQNAHFVCCGCTLVDEDANGEVTKIQIPRLPSSGKFQEVGALLTATLAARKEVFQQVGGYTDRFPVNEHDELRMRLHAVCERNGWRVAVLQEPLVRRTTVKPADDNVDSLYESGINVLKRHSSELRRNPRAFAEWATAAGHCAAQLGRYREARQWFLEAMRTDPRDLRSLFRYLLAGIPGLRWLVWRPANRPAQAAH